MSDIILVAASVVLTVLATRLWHYITTHDFHLLHHADHTQDPQETASGFVVLSLRELDALQQVIEMAYALIIYITPYFPKLGRDRERDARLHNFVETYTAAGTVLASIAAGATDHAAR